MKFKSPTASELQARIAFLESTNTAIRQENSRLRSGDNDHVLAQLHTAIATAEQERNKAREERDHARQRAHYADLRVQELNVELEQLKRRRSRKEELVPLPSPTKEMWRRLIQLVHPDKHSNSDAAHTATQWLLENRP
jgi:chromosome segregation ATPase